MTDPTDTAFERDLRAALHRRGDALHVPAPSRRPTRAPRLIPALGLAAAAVLLVGVGALVMSRDDGRQVGSVPPSDPVVAAQLTPTEPDLAAASNPSDDHRVLLAYPNPGVTERGPFAVVLRATDGDFALRSAIVTWPVSRLIGAEAVRVGDTDGQFAGPRRLTWPLAGQVADVTSDLGRDTMIQLAEATTVIDGRLVVAPPPGFTVEYQGTSEASEASALRYGAAEFASLGGNSLGAMLFIETSNAIDDERAALGMDVVRTYQVLGHRAVARPLANGALVFQIAPGRYTTVGWSGNSSSEALYDVLARIAATTTTLTRSQVDQYPTQVIPPAGTTP